METACWMQDRVNVPWFQIGNAIWLDNISLHGHNGHWNSFVWRTEINPFHLPSPVCGVRGTWLELPAHHSLLLVLLVALQCKFDFGDHHFIHLQSVPPPSQHEQNGCKCKKTKLFTAKSFLLLEISLPVSLDDMPLLGWGLLFFDLFCSVSFCLDLEICPVTEAASMGLRGWGGSSAHPAPSRSCRVA